MLKRQRKQIFQDTKHTEKYLFFSYKGNLEWQAPMEASKEGNCSWLLSTLPCRKMATVQDHWLWMSVVWHGELISHVAFDPVFACAVLAFHPWIVSLDVPSDMWQQHSYWVKSFWFNPVWCPLNPVLILFEIHYQQTPDLQFNFVLYKRIFDYLFKDWWVEFRWSIITKHSLSINLVFLLNRIIYFIFPFNQLHR